jgi:tRNA threonylcarbamoyladenosine biosynthesis protein TsaB
VTALAIDTATESLGLCLESDGLRRTCVMEVGLKHSEGLLPAVQSLLDQAGIAASGLDLVVCCTGPGSFTGIRIGLATAKGLSFGAGSPLIGVANLDALAFRYRRFPGLVVPVLPALRRNYYAALYREGTRITEYLAVSLDELAEKVRLQPEVLLTGRAAALLYERLAGAPTAAGPAADSRDQVHATAALEGSSHVPAVSPDAAGRTSGGTILDLASASSDPVSLLEIGKGELARRAAAPGDAPLEEPQPLYLRKSDAEISRGR